MHYIAVGLIALGLFAGEPDPEERLRAAAREGDVQQIERLLAAGVDVNAATRYRLTPLYYAADRGHDQAVRVLLQAGAQTEIPNEPFYRLSPMIMAARKGHAGVVRQLLAADASCGTWTAQWPAWNRHSEVVEVLVEQRPDIFTSQQLDGLAAIADQTSNARLLKFLTDRGASVEAAPQDSTATFTALTTAELESLDGTYKASNEGPSDEGAPDEAGDGANTATEASTRIWARQGKLYLGAELGLAAALKQVGPRSFVFQETPQVTVSFARPLGTALTITDSTTARGVAQFERQTAADTHQQRVALGAGRWTRLRGPRGAGNADGLQLPTQFDAKTGQGLVWKTRIPGVGHSSPVIWGDRVVVTTAEPLADDPQYDLRVASGFDTHNEQIDYRWFAVCVSLSSGELLWQTQLDQGRPVAQRHIMSSHANCTPAVDGKHIVVNLAGQGVFCLNHDGELLWERKLGRLAAGWFMDPGYEWGFASSPVIHGDRVVLQCDVFDGSFITALRLQDGGTLWQTPREDVSSWGTPLICDTAAGPQIVANGTRAIAGYDLADGTELWRVTGNSEATVASPIPNGDHVLVTGGYAPVQPLFSIAPTARGDVTPPDDEQATAAVNTAIQWHSAKGGAYTVTPLVYRDLLYILTSSGVVTCRDAATGRQVYKARVASGRCGDIVASPIAADGFLYIADSGGDVFVLPAGDEYTRPNVCPVGEPLMATPAAAPGRLVVRGLHHLYGFAP